MKVAIEKTQVCAYDFSNKEEIIMHSLRYLAKPVPILSSDQPYKYLGVRITIKLDWKHEKASVLEHVCNTIEYLKDTAYMYKQLDRVVRTCIVPVFRYSSAIVQWTKSELDEITAILNRAMRKAWKLQRSFAGMVLQMQLNMGGLGALCAETLHFQEMWGLYEQSLLHNDSVRQLMEWELEDAKNRRGCSTLQQVASDAYLQRSCTFIERLLGSLYGMGFKLNSSEVLAPIKHNLVEVFEPWRMAAVSKLREMEGAGWRDWVWGLPGSTAKQDRDVSLKWAVWNKTQIKLRAFNRMITVLARATVNTYDKLVATTKGDWLSFPIVQRMMVWLTLEHYEVFIAVLGSLVGEDARRLIGNGVSQHSLLSFYAKISRSEHLLPDTGIPERSVLEAFEHQVTQFFPSREVRVYQKKLISSLQGEFPLLPRAGRTSTRKCQLAYNSDAEHDPHQHIQNISNMEEERIVEGALQFRCSFSRVEPAQSANLISTIQK